MADRPSISRRRVVQLTGVAGVAALAGCPGDGDGGTPTDTSTPTETGTATETPTVSDTQDEAGPPRPDEPTGIRPIVFVHGSSGSAAQFESNAMRFASNGYDQALLSAYEYDTSVDLEQNRTEVHEGLDEHVSAVLESTDADHVDVLGHSRGTLVMHGYLDDDERASSVANYVNIDGMPADRPPGNRRTLAVWADYGIGGRGDLSIGGDAENVSFAQTHVEVATSRETFGAIYPFLTGEEPVTTAIEPAEPGDVTVAGRTAIFPQNEGVADATLELYEIDPSTAERVTDEPHASPELAADGTWGPVAVDGEARYEAVLLRADAPAHHFYAEPALRSNHFVRLLTSRPGEGVDQLIERGPDHTSIAFSRDKEFWGDQEPADSLTVGGTVLINAATASRADTIVAPIVFDASGDGESDPSEPIDAFADIPFLTGVDLHLPAADPPDDTIEVVSTPRDGDGLERRVTVRNWASDEHRVSVRLPDHVQQQ